MADIFEKCFRPSMADLAKSKGIYPYFHALESRQDSTVIMDGKRKIMLGSNNYLGLTINPEIMEAGIRATEKYGTGCSGSRFLNGTLDMHLELEETLAGFLRQETALVFSTGFLANLGIISALAGRNDYILSDKENHASIYDGIRLGYAKMLRYNHSDMADLEAKLQSVPETAGKLIITDGVFSMGGDIARLPEIVGLAKKYQARVMVDDAHGLGVIGKGGRGTPSYFGLEKEVDIYMGTFSKSLASLGGYMAADERVVSYVKHNSRPFIFSASIPPSNTAVALAALRHLIENPQLPERLQFLSSYLREGLKGRKLDIIDSNTPIIPIYTYDLTRTIYKAREVYDEGVYVNPVLPPATHPAYCLLRTSVIASLTEELLDEAIDVFDRVLNREDHYEPLA